MATNPLLYIPLSELSWSGVTSLFPNNEVGNSLADDVGATLTWSGNGKKTLFLNDDDGTFNDDWDSGQTLARPMEVPGTTTVAAGTAVEPQYGYILTGSDGSTVTIYAVDLRGNNPLGTETVDGIVMNKPLKPGVTYTVTEVFEIADPPYSSLAPCFTPGTMIRTPDGVRDVADIRAGDWVETLDDGPQQVRWAGQRRLTPAQLAATPNLIPIRIRAGALGNGLPQRDLIVSPQHRVLVRSQIAIRMFDTAEILVAAKHLLEVDGIELATDQDSVTYVHFLFDKHQIVYSEGALTESLYTGPQALKAISPQAREEILTLFPELKQMDETGYVPPKSRHFISGREGRNLAARHAKNAKPLYHSTL